MATKINDNLTEGPIAKSLIIFALPVLFGNVLQSLNGSINAIWIGHFLGENAFAGTSNANNVMFLLLSAVFGIGMAATILIAQSIGAKDLEQSKRVIGASFLFYFSVSVVVAAVGFVFSPEILRGMGTPHPAMPYAIAYLRVIFVGIPFMFLYMFVMTVLRGAGDSKTPFLFLLISSALDIGLNPVLIFGLGPAPRLGVAGSATATAIAQFVSLACLVIFLYRKNHFLCLRRADTRYVRFDREIIGSLVRKGIPMGLQMIVVSSSAIAMISLINSFGAMATAAFGAAMQISSYVQMPAMAIGAAVSTVAAQNVGAGKWDRVHRTTMVGVLTNFAMTGVLVGIIYVFNRQALELFLNPGQATDIGMKINAITLWGFILFGITFVISGVVRSTGSVVMPLIITFVALWCIRIPVAYLLGHQFGLDFIWWSFPFGFILGTLLSALYYLFGNWKEAKMLRTTSPAGKPG